MDRFDVLRQKAKSLLEKDTLGKSIKEDDLKKLVEDMEILHIELDIQNQEIREAQAALSRSQREFYALFEFAPVGYAVLTHDGVIKQLNKKGAELFNASKANLINSRFNAFVFPPGVDFKYFSFQLANHEDSRTTEIEFITGGGLKRWARLELSCWSGEADEQNPRVLCAFIDITEQKSAEQELITYRHHLEELVRQRTTELETANRKLSEEIQTRIQSEANISNSLKEKEILLREIHHRVKNNMQIIISLLRINSRKIKDQRLNEIFTESQNRIQAMAIIHETLYQQKSLVSIDFSEYLKRLTNSQLRSYASLGQSISIDIKVNNLKLSIDQVIPCSLIINELVSNSLKYAFPDNREGRIEISMTEHPENMLELSVSDNGVGIPDHIDLENSQTMGMTIVFNLARRQLNAAISIENQQGIKFIICFPQTTITPIDQTVLRA